MAFSMKLDKNLEKQLQKIVRSQLSKSAAEARLEGVTQEKAVHQIRKRCKKIRGLLRLVRYDLKESSLYKEKNEAFKQLAHILSGERDKKVMGDTFAKIVKRYNLDYEQFKLIAEHIQQLHEEQTEDKSVKEKLQEAAKVIEKELNEISRYELKHNSFKGVKKGVKKGYKKCQKRYEHALESPRGDNFHQWRKWVKYHWYHERILKKNAHCLLNARVNRLKLLSDVLGDEHDLTVFKEYIHKVNAPYEQEFESYLNQEQRYLRNIAYEMGEELFCAPSKKFVKYSKAIFQL